jgi:hypothetical protein
MPKPLLQIHSRTIAPNIFHSAGAAVPPEPTKSSFTVVPLMRLWTSKFQISEKFAG